MLSLLFLLPSLCVSNKQNQGQGFPAAQDRLDLHCLSYPPPLSMRVSVVVEPNGQGPGVGDACLSFDNAT